MEVPRPYRSAEGLKPSKPAFVLDSLSIRSRLQPYNCLYDLNLRNYFANKRRRQLLLKGGVITPAGELRQNTSQIAPKDSKERFFLANERDLSVYSRRSQSVRLGKQRKNREKKPVTHQELQRILDKYRPKMP